jgi:hypothetical protein
MQSAHGLMGCAQMVGDLILLLLQGFYCLQLLSRYAYGLLLFLFFAWGRTYYMHTDSDYVIFKGKVKVNGKDIPVPGRGGP